MRNIRFIVIHCTATPPDTTVSQLLRSFRARGWKSPGYHYVVERSGRYQTTCDPARVANGVKGYNHCSVHVAYIGGIDALGHPVDNRTDLQRTAMRTLVGVLRATYPHARVVGHRDLSPDRNGDGRISPSEWVKACPCFDAMKEYSTV